SSGGCARRGSVEDGAPVNPMAGSPAASGSTAGYPRSLPEPGTYPWRTIAPPVPRPPPSLGFTWNQAAPARGVVSPAGITAVPSSPQTVPPAVSVCCLRSSPPSRLLFEPLCGGDGGPAYASGLIDALHRVRRPAPAAPGRLS